MHVMLPDSNILNAECLVAAAEGPGRGGRPRACEHTAQHLGWGAGESTDPAAVDAADEPRVSTNRLWGRRTTSACKQSSTHPAVLLRAYWWVTGSWHVGSFYHAMLCQRGICCHRASLCHKLILYRNDWKNRARFWRGGFLPPILHCVIRKSEYLLKLVLPSGTFSQTPDLDNLATAIWSCCQQNSLSLQLVSAVAWSVCTCRAFCFFLTICLENPEMSRNLTAVRQLKIIWSSGHPVYSRTYFELWCITVCCLYCLYSVL